MLHIYVLTIDNNFVLCVGFSWAKIWLSSNSYVYYIIRIRTIKGGIS